MRITKQLIRKMVTGPVERVAYLDLSSMKIGYIECLDDCQRLNTLILQDNVIDSILNIEWCRELWILNLSRNRIKSLQGLSRFTALGTLDLSNNKLDWIELKRLSHLHLLSLWLTGNNKLDTDPYYRHHVIDILPHLWMLDGQIITAGERRHVSKFFASSAATSHPVRHKFNNHSVFVPTNLQNLLVTGVYGEKTTHLMANFPLKYSHNIDLDKRRLMYLTELIEEDIKLEIEHKLQKGEEEIVIPSLQQLMEQRCVEKEQCNMLLLLLVIALEFELPTDLMIATLETAKISHIKGFVCKDLFTLPFHIMYKVTCLLLSGAAIDRDEHKEGGLYPQLYEGLQCLVCSSLSKKHHSTSSTSPTHSPHIHSQYRCLVASEVVHLMCLVPLFFEYLDNNTNVLEMVAVATNVSGVEDVISHIAWKIHNSGGDIWHLYHEIASYLLHTTTSNVFSKKNNKRLTSQRPATTSTISRSASPTRNVRQASSQIFQSPKRSSPHVPRRAVSAGGVPSSRRSAPQPGLGDTVLCAPERLARIIAIPEPHVAVLQLISSPVRGDTISGPPDSYFYTDPRGLVWDGQMGYWSKDDLTSELSAGRLNPPLPIHYNESSSYSTLRSPSPDLSIGFTRPSSQMSYISEDLQTIPSIEELSLIDEMTPKEQNEEEEEEMREDDSLLPMKVEITTSPIRTMSQRPKTPEEIEEAQLSHQQHILEQYSIHKTAQRMEREEKEANNMTTTTTSTTASNGTPPPSNEIELCDLTIPTPSLHFPSTWSSSKSLSHSLTSSLVSKDKTATQSSVIDKLISPPPPPVPASSRIDLIAHRGSMAWSTKSTSTVNNKEPSTPVVVLAWSPVKSGYTPKQTKLSSMRTAAHAKTRSSSPIITNKSSRPTSRQSSTSSFILKTRGLSPSPVPLSSSSSSPFQTTAAYTHHKTTSTNNKQNFINYRPSTGKKGSSNATRKLGDVGMFLEGTSVW